MSEPAFTIANLLTFLRMGLVPLLVILVLQQEFDWALVVFVVAGVTDLLDGLAARRRGQLTRLGATLDPIADKLLLSACFIVLTWTRGLAPAIPQWLAVLVLSRDVLIVITALVVVLTLGARVFYPSRLGKATTAVQIVTSGAVLAANALATPTRFLQPLFVLCAGLTVASGLHYVYLALGGRRAIGAAVAGQAGEASPPSDAQEPRS